MNRYSLRPLMLLLALTGACGDSTQPSTADMAMNPSDMSTANVSDLTSIPRDMSPPKLEFTCATANVTAATVYTNIIVPNCSGAGCHRGGGTQAPVFGNSGANLITAVVGKQSSASMNFVTANSPDTSYLLFKVFGQQNKVTGGGGSQMPLGANALSTADQCLLVNWVRSGAQ